MLRRAATLLALASAAAGALSACTLAPPNVRPAPPVAQSWPTAATAGPSAGDLAWREVILDPKLQGVVDLALAQNRDLRVAVSNIARARAQYRVQRAALLPTINAAGTESQIREPASITTTGVGAGAVSQGGTVSRTGQAVVVEQYTATVGVSAYELDLFGRVRSLSQADLEAYFAVEENRRTAQISLISEVAADYLTLASDQDLLKVSKDTLKSREDGMMLAQKRFDAGATSELDLRQEQTLAEQARSDVAVATARVNTDLDALVLVVGAGIPAALMPDGGLANIQLRADLPAGLPSEVLVRRPDVLSAEHSLRAQNADIGAARAAFFPRITLTGSTGHASSDLGNLFSNGTGYWSFTPQIVLPLFAGGANLANLRYARAGRDVAVAQYEKAIQTAFRDVADALAVQATIDDRIAAQTRLVEAATVTQRLTQARYDRGIDSYLALLDAQRTLYAARQTLIAAQLVQATNRVTLYEALGGGAGPAPADLNRTLLRP